MNEIEKKVQSIGVVPVIKLNHPERDAIPLAKALIAGGVPVAEVTFRAAGAAVAIKAMRMFSDMAKNQVESETAADELQHLSRTEWRIIAKVGNGLSNREIAAELAFTEGTVRNYISVILDKLSLRDRTQLAIWALQNQRLVRRGSQT